MVEHLSHTPDIHKFYVELQKSFLNLFVHQHCQQDIAKVIEALQEKKPIADLMQSSSGSFSTIFLPFHAGGDRFQALAKIHRLHPKLLEFCSLAGKIEGLTDTMGISGEEPSSKSKEELLLLLPRFLTILPSYEEFQQWSSP